MDPVDSTPYCRHLLSVASPDARGAFFEKRPLCCSNLMNQAVYQGLSESLSRTLSETHSQMAQYALLQQGTILSTLNKGPSFLGAASIQKMWSLPSQGPLSKTHHTRAGAAVDKVDKGGLGCRTISAASQNTAGQLFTKAQSGSFVIQK